MKNKKKAIFVILLLSLFILIVHYKTNVKVTSDFKGLPCLSDYRNLSQEEQINTIKKIDSMPINDAVKYFEKKILNYVNKEKLVDLIKLNIYEDNLLMYENQNKKTFNNLFIDIEVSIGNKDTTITKEEVENISSKMNKEIYDLCDKNTYGFLKLNTVNINFIDNSNKLNYEYENTNTMASEIVNINQSKEELETQNIIYNFVHQHKNFSLKKFGIIDNKKELYIEIPIYDIYDEKEQTSILQSLKDISNSLYNKIKSEKYIKNNNINIVNITFNTPWNKDEYITYNYKIQ